MLYELLILLKDGQEVHTVETIWSKARTDLESIALERKLNNPNYLTMIIEYKAINATIV